MRHFEVRTAQTHRAFHGPRAAIYAVAIFCLGAFAAPARAVSNFCPFGTCDIANPVYVNVYWDSSASQWDSDAASVSTDLKEARIDAFVEAMVHSGYFSALAQYSVTGASSLPSITASGCAAAPGKISQALNSVGALVTCVLNAHPSLNRGNTIVNVFLPPQVQPDNGWCNVGGNTLAEHDEFGTPVAVTFVPTNSACVNIESAGTFDGFTSSLSHEMVEATTDPNPSSPTGWKNFGGGEIGDSCEQNDSPFLFGHLQKYWSDKANGCVPGINLTAPQITGVSVCGTGPSARIQVAGTFDPNPWDLSGGAFAGQTLYLQAAISGGHSWDAGNIVGATNSTPDTADFGPIQWQTNFIQVSGFTGAYGGSQVFWPGDQITVTVWSPSTGQSASQSAPAPFPANLGTLTVSPSGANILYADGQATVTGYASDAAGCAVEGAPVTLTATAGTFPTQPVQSNSGGIYSAPYGAPAVAGNQTLTATTPVASGALSASAVQEVWPLLTSESPVVGPVTGGQAVTVQGLGFAAGATTLSFNAAPASVSNVAPTTFQVATPPSPLPGSGVGFVNLTGAVNGLPATTLDAYAPLQYEYVIAGVPVIQYQNTGCGVGTITVSVYSASGALEQVPIAVSGPANAFVNAQGQKVGGLTLNSGQSTTLSGDGPVTATNTQNPTLTSTLSDIAANGGKNCIPLGTLNPGAIWPPEFNQCLACTVTTVAWNSIPDNSDLASQGGWVEMSGTSAQLNGTYAVTSVNSAGLFAGGQPTVSVTVGGATAAAATYELLGKPISVAASGHPLYQAVKLPVSAQLSFTLPKDGFLPSAYRVLRLVPDKQGRGTWTVNKAAPAAHGIVINAPLTQTGVYALARVRAAAKPKPLKR